MIPTPLRERAARNTFPLSKQAVRDDERTMNLRVFRPVERKDGRRETSGTANLRRY